jgi:hypothetical protein
MKYTDIEDICSTSNTVMQIIKNTKDFVKSEYKYRRFLKSSYQSSSNLQSYASSTSTTLSRPQSVISRYTRPQSVISKCAQSVKDFSKIDDDIFQTKPTFQTKYSAINFNRKKTFIKTSVEKTDIFSSNFYEFLNIEEKIVDIHIDERYTVEQYCVKYLDKVRERRLNFETKLKKVYNEDHEMDEVHINLKSFKIALRNENSLNTDDKPIIAHIPFELVFVFAFLTVEEIILILSQLLFFDENLGRICFVSDKVPSLLKTKFFDLKKGSTINNKYKFDKNLSFKIISEKNVYIATLYCPEITFHFVNRNFTITKHIYLEFLIYLFNNSFLNWDEAVLYYFKSNKEFRFHFSKITSKSNPYKLSPNKIYLNIDKRFKTLKEIYIASEISIPMVFKDREQLKFVNIFGYSVELKSMRVEKFFNWKVSLILLQLRNKINIDSWINRRTKVDVNGKIIFDKNWYEELDNNIIQFICKESEVFHERRMQFRINEPRIIIQTIGDGKISRDVYCLPKDELNLLSTTHKLDDFINHMQKNITHMNNYLVEIRSI